MGEALIVRRGGNNNIKRKVLLAKDVSMSLRADSSTNDSQNITFSTSLDDYEKIEIYINGSLSCFGGAFGASSSTLSLNFTNAISATIRTVGEYGPNDGGSEDISGIYTYTISTPTSNKITFIVYSGQRHTKFSGTVSIYGIPK